MAYTDEMRLTGMESTIRRWRDGSAASRTSIVVMLLVSVVLTLCFGEKMPRLIIWIICLVSVAALTYADYRYLDLIARGGRALIGEEREALETKRRLSAIGVIDYNADFDRELMNIHRDRETPNVPLLFYVITNGIGVAMMIYVLAKYFI